MFDDIDPNWRKELQKMTSQERRVYLRIMLRLRFHCPRCPVKTPQMDREPCYACTMLPGDLGRVTTTMN